MQAHAIMWYSCRLCLGLFSIVNSGMTRRAAVERSRLCVFISIRFISKHSCMELKKKYKQAYMTLTLPAKANLNIPRKMVSHRKELSLACSLIFNSEWVGVCRLKLFEDWLLRKCSGDNVLAVQGEERLFNIEAAALAMRSASLMGPSRTALEESRGHWIQCRKTGAQL
jgi:hypothetical protein